MRRLSLALLALSLAAEIASGQSILRTLSTPTIGNRFGNAIARLGDLNGDGYEDLAVGAPNPAHDGTVYAVSGRYLALGTGSQFLWTNTKPGPKPGAQFGVSLANVGDVDGDGKSDVAVGMPYSWDSILGWVGAAYILSGANGAQLVNMAYLIDTPFGIALAALGDLDGDGSIDLAIGSPLGDSGATDAGSVFLLSPRKLYLGQAGALLGQLDGAQPGEQFGSAIAAADLDNDGKAELFVGAPYFDGFQTTDAGRIIVYRGSTLTPWRTLFGTKAGGRLGYVLSAGGDVDGDGVEELIAGVPYDDGGAVDAGLAILYSGAKLVSGAAPYDIARFEHDRANAHFGSSVDITLDVNGDGFRDIVVGAPDWQPLLFGQDNGAIYVYSGETFEQLGWRSGAADDHLGATVLGVGDYDGDGRAEFAVGSVFSDAAVPDGGRLDVMSLFPVQPTFYCTSKVNSVGCTPFVSYSGSPSVSSPSPFDIRASNVINNKNGLLFYGLDVFAAPFQGGTLCVAPPTKRTSVQATGGNPPPNDCSGTLSYDFNALIQSGANPNLVLGQEVFVQYWSRDPSSPSTTSLTNALRFVIGH